MAISNTAVNTVKIARAVKQTFGKNSLTRRAQDTIMQFPVIMSAGIPLDDAVILTKAFESQYAALLVSVISCNSDYNRGKYANPVDYLKTFHNNSDIPTILMSMDSAMPGDVDLSMCVLESAMTLHSLENLVDPQVCLECWGDNMEKYNNTSLNSLYQPHAHTQQVMESVVANLRGIERPALEGAADDIAALTGALPGKVDKNDVGVTKDPNKVKSIAKTKQVIGPNGQGMVDSKGKPITETVYDKEYDIRKPAMTGVQQVANYNDKLGALAPTLVNLQLNSHHGDGPVITHNVVMGVKGMARMISQDLMISNLVDAVNNSRAVFAFIKWTEGNLSLIKDVLLGINSAKNMAAADRDMQKWMTSLKRRKQANLTGKLTSGQGIPPCTTIICTNYDVARVQEQTGLDLSEPYVAVKLLNDFYLLSFVIYDPETGRVQAIFDGDTDFSTNSISALKTKQQKEVDLKTYSQFIRAAGRM